MPASAGTARTTRLRKVVCAGGCGTIARQSRAQWAAHGLMACACGEPMIPAALEDAVACADLGLLTAEQLEQHDEYRAYQRETASVMHGQAPHVQRGVQSLKGLRDPADIAYGRVLADRADQAKRNQLDALRDFNPRLAGAAACEPIPF
jgi:hypothetical protein